MKDNEPIFELTEDDFEDLYIECNITRQLDEALRKKGNVKISGMTGSGKTSIVKSWLNHYKDKVNGYYLDCALLRDCSGNVYEKNKLTVQGQLFTSEEIDEIESKPNRVIVFDNYHLASRNLKNHILLLCDRYLVDEREEDGFKKLRNIEFVCVINTDLF